MRTLKGSKERSVMFAVIRTGGKQYRVAANDVIAVEKLAGEAGRTIEFGEVLALSKGEGLTLGAPLIEGARVSATLLEQTRGPKIIVFKKKRRKGYRRKRGHRQDLTVVRIEEILAPGEEPGRKPAKEAKPKKPAAKKAVRKPAAKAKKPEAKKVRPKKLRAKRRAVAKPAGRPEKPAAKAPAKPGVKKPAAKKATAKAKADKARAKAPRARKTAAKARKLKEKS